MLPRCDAIQGAKPFRNPGPRALRNKRQCKRDGTIPSPTGPVCHQHHNNGFVSWSQTFGAATTPVVDMAVRAAAVLEGEAA